ncbi:MAG TPA: ABC transporter ATP-binding protein [Acidimicrobiales bacterium]|nr:ABC transporter ATP-binding protein [Acidimicrobiales bacterium]
MTRTATAPAATSLRAGSPPAVELDGLTKRYDRKTVLDDVSLRIDPGSFSVLLGPSGSGKSTLARCVAGIERVDAGAVRFDGQVMAGSRTHVSPDQRGLAMVFQDYALWPHMTALENIAFALRRLRPSRESATARAAGMLERVGLGALGGRYPGDLSGGEQQRVALARAMVAEPGLLLFDEPLSNLDADLRERLRVEIATLTRETGCTVIYITHDQSEAFALADRIGVLEQGRLVQYAAPEELYSRPATAFVARFTGLAGELPCQVSAAGEPDLVTVSVGGHRVTGRGAPGRSVRPGEAAVVLIRSGAVGMGPEPGGSGAGDGHGMPAVVRDVAFRGRGYDHVVELPGRQRLVGIFHPLRHERGTAIRLRLDAGGCIVFPGDHGAPDPDATGSAASGAGTRPEPGPEGPGGQSTVRRPTSQ